MLRSVIQTEPVADRLRTRGAVAMLVALFAALMVWVQMTGTAQAASPAGLLPRPVDTSSEAIREFLAPDTLRIQGSDWLLGMWKIAQLRAAPPVVPVVYLLGGSSARECTVNDTDWADQIASLGGPEVIAINLGSRNQTFGQDLQIVKNLPKSVPSIVFIGVSQGRFDLGQMDSRVRLPEASSPQPLGTQHHYNSKKIYSLATKRALVGAWMKTVYPKFRARYSANFAILEQIVKKCIERGLHPVLVDLPRLTAVIGHAWDAPHQAVPQRLLGVEERVPGALLQLRPGERFRAPGLLRLGACGRSWAPQVPGAALENGSLAAQEVQHGARPRFLSRRTRGRGPWGPSSRVAAGGLDGEVTKLEGAESCN